MNQTLISSLERGPYPGMRLWDVYKLCRVYGIQLEQVLEALGWSDRPPESKAARRLAVISEALREMDDGDVETILRVAERYIVGTRSLER